MNKTPHVHKFKLHKFKTGSSTFFCALPDCSKKSAPGLLLGKESICWRCGEKFILTEYSIRLVKPHCENCHKPSKKYVKPYDSSIHNPEAVTPTLHPLEVTDSRINSLPLSERLSKAMNNEKLDFSEEEEEEI